MIKIKQTKKTADLYNGEFIAKILDITPQFSEDRIPQLIIRYKHEETITSQTINLREYRMVGENRIEDEAGTSERIKELGRIASSCGLTGEIELAAMVGASVAIRVRNGKIINVFKKV